ncbi:hypothetical protein [Altererythrobacter sp. TH136]|uniref:hypothetical protein n=1 Tax=Altererythrobacter sp. TH136 TaxID=2067415 RepID=UPI001165485D|nr:hypothetical protein [Altererythrobacter sp. TH136]QDM39944.1 hypothetical protein C0V74_01920 [Altererythrobacter sp. TH136]
MTSRRFLRVLIPGVLIVSAVLVIRLLADDPTINQDGLTFAGEELARALDRPGDGPGMRVIRSFTDPGGVPCRAFLGEAVSGIACRKDAGWHLRVARSGIDVSDPAAVAHAERALLRSAEQMEVQ